MESDNYDIFSKGRGEWKTNNKGKMNFKDNSRVQAILEKRNFKERIREKGMVLNHLLKILLFIQLDVIIIR